MAFSIVPIFTQVVGSGGAGNIVFTNIPSTYTDLKIIISARASNNNAGTGQNFIGYYFNGDPYPAASGFRSLAGNGSSVSSSGNSGFGVAGSIADSSQTSNTFSNNEMYIPNYASTNFKQIIIDSVTENNATASQQSLHANLYRISAPINRISFDTSNGAFVAGSTFTLYGIKPS